MVKKVPRRKFNSIKSNDFNNVSESFIKGAELAYEFEYHNAAGVLIIHAAIALADAVTIKLSSQKCSGDNHYEIISLLKDVTPDSKLKNNAVNQFKNLIDHKNAVSYSGDIYLKKDLDKLFKHFDRFSKWAQSILE